MLYSQQALQRDPGPNLQAETHAVGHITADVLLVHLLATARRRRGTVVFLGKKHRSGRRGFGSIRPDSGGVDIRLATEQLGLGANTALGVRVSYSIAHTGGYPGLEAVDVSILRRTDGSLSRADMKSMLRIRHAHALSTENARLPTSTGWRLMVRTTALTPSETSEGESSSTIVYRRSMDSPGYLVMPPSNHTRAGCGSLDALPHAKNDRRQIQQMDLSNPMRFVDESGHVRACTTRAQDYETPGHPAVRSLDPIHDSNSALTSPRDTTVLKRTRAHIGPVEPRPEDREKRRRVTSPTALQTTEDTGTSTTARSSPARPHETENTGTVGADRDNGMETDADGIVPHIPPNSHDRAQARMMGTASAGFRHSPNALGAD